MAFLGSFAVSSLYGTNSRLLDCVGTSVSERYYSDHHRMHLHLRDMLHPDLHLSGHVKGKKRGEEERKQREKEGGGAAEAEGGECGGVVEVKVQKARRKGFIVG